MDESTFESLFHTYYASLVRYVMSIVESRDIARELVQDVFLALWASRNTPAMRDPAVGYLYTAARNRALKYVRHERVVRRHERSAAQALHDMLADDTAPDTADGATRDHEIDTAVRQALAALPDRAREAFLLYREQGLSHKEIAAVMGVSVRTVETHVRRAVVLLREALAPFR